jgi:DNA-binding NtrC family response regulator
MTNLDLTGRHILLVEDDYMLARALVSLLETWNATILGPVATTERALALMGQTDRIDLAVIDVNLRGETSFALADDLIARGVPHIFMTGYGASTIPERYRGAAILQKPFKAAKLVEAILALIG